MAEVIDEWLFTAGITRKQYLSQVINRGSSIDGLFVWLAAVHMGCHLNIIHGAGIWMTRASETVVMTDCAIVFIIHCFMSTPSMHLTAAKDSPQDSDSDSDFMCAFRPAGETTDRYVQVPQVLNDPVERADEVGMSLQGHPCPLQVLLAELLHTSPEEFRKMLVSWIYQHRSEEHMIEKWLVVRGLDLETYAVHLTSGGTSDGLELWCFLRATDQPVTVIMEKTVVSTAVEGIDLSQIMIMLSSYTSGYLCAQLESDASGEQENTEPVISVP